MLRQKMGGETITVLQQHQHPVVHLKSLAGRGNSEHQVTKDTRAKDGRELSSAMLTAVRDQTHPALPGLWALNPSGFGLK